MRLSITLEHRFLSTPDGVLCAQTVLPLRILEA